MDLILTAHKMRIYPNDEQINIIETTFGAARRMFNSLHAQFEERSRMDAVEKEKHVYKNYTALKNEWDNDNNWLKNVAGQALANVSLNYNKAWSNYKKNKKHYKIPTFKSKHKAKKSYSLNKNSVGNDIYISKDNDKLLKVPKLGFVKLSQKIRYSNYNLKKITISKSSTNKYYISILVEINKESLNHKDLKTTSVEKIGLDLGLIDYIVDSNGNRISNPKHLKKFEVKLAKEQKLLSRKYEQAKKDGRLLSESKNYQKQKLKVAKFHEKIRNVRNDFLHKLTNTITNESQVVIVESLNVKGMMKNKNLSKHISDASWGNFVNQLEYKSERKERTFVKIDTFFPSSKMCSDCKETHELTNDLSVREWQCPSCNSIHDRDINAAINILNEGLTLI